MYDKRPVRWVIELKSDGTFVNWIPLSSGEGTAKDRGKEMFVPYVVGRTSAIKPTLLVDNPSYVLGTTDPKRGEEKHKAFVELVKKCASETGLQSVKAVEAFLSKGQLPEPPENMQESDLVTFRVEGVFPIDDPKVQEFWDR
ncbi:MAG: type I-C CRISPR-associated protein Cas8c/Csd1, partial [Armatimonadota bacterium]